MKNKIVKALAVNDSVRIYCINTTELCNKMRLVHNCWPTSLASLGRVASVTAIMAKMLKKEDERIIVQINGHGPLGTVMVECFQSGALRGFVGDPSIYLKYNDSNKLAVGLAVGQEGYLKVTKDLKMKSNFTGQVELQSGEIGDDFAYYFMVSEQTPSVVSCGVLVDIDHSCKAAGALIIQLLPHASEEDIQTVEACIKGLKPISQLIEEMGDPSCIVNSLFNDVAIVEESDVFWQCDCDSERFKMGLLTLKLEDLENILVEDKKIDIKCEYCNSSYHFDEAELKEMVDYKKLCGR